MKFLLPILFLVANLWTTAASGQQLVRYSCFADHLDAEGYESDSPLYTKDAQGVIEGDKGYHPVRICIYGILNYERFRETGDSSHYFRCIRQANYFANPDNYHEKFGGKGVGYPYLFDYKDSKAPFYSGMAQGLAISYLLRYSELVGDTGFYPLIRKTAYLLLQPEAEGGTISQSAETGTWIEEYVNSKITRQVLNGSINGWIGLHEYCTYFPEDHAAARMRDAAYETLVHSLEKFNIPEWCRYDLMDKKCTPGYLRYQVYELQQLYEITGEEKFYRQLMLWATLLYNHDLEIGTAEYSRRSHKIAVKSPPDELPKFGMMSALKKQGIQVRSYNFTSTRALENYLERGVTPPAADARSDEKMIVMEFSDLTRLDYFSIHYESDMETPPQFSLWIVSENSKKTAPLAIEADQLGPQDWHCRILGDQPQKGFRRLILKAHGRQAGSIRNTQIGLYNTASIHMPRFGYYNTSQLSLEAGQKYCLYVPHRRTGDIRLFWRYAETKEGVWEVPFQPNDYVKGSAFTPEKTGFYQFSIIYELKNVLSNVGMMLYEAH